MGRLFGTDGIRGLANVDLTCELAMEIGKATALVLTKHQKDTPKILIGKDTRLSGDMLENAMAAGLCAMGADVELLGVVPTPAVAHLVRKYTADAGIMISASHNPAEYNGIKMFGWNGFKIPDEYEKEIEDLVLAEELIPTDKDGLELGSCTVAKMAVDDYVEFITNTCDYNLGGIRVLLDCANGSASITAGLIFQALGLDCSLIGNSPDGLNINENCGSMCIENLGKQVVQGDYDIGIAFDGDADRVLVVDSRGNLVDGDKLLAIFASDMVEKGLLKKNVIVGTVMSNMGLMRFGLDNSIKVVTTKVGDRFVLEEMEEFGYNLGGEQSGHIILRDFHTTGDGQLAAVQLLKIMRENETSIEELASLMEKYPQVMEGVEATPAQKAVLKDDRPFQDSLKEWKERLGKQGRILVRPSGTEPVIRVMAEGRDLTEIQECVTSLSQVIRESIGTA